MSTEPSNTPDPPRSVEGAEDYPSSRERMDAFDRLPAPLRAVLREAPANISVQSAWEALAGHIFDEVEMTLIAVELRARFERMRRVGQQEYFDGVFYNK